MRIEATVRGSSVTVVECRPSGAQTRLNGPRCPSPQLRLVPAVLDDVRRHLRAVKDRLWPPAWFDADQGSTPDVAARPEDLLDGGFGRPA